MADTITRAQRSALMAKLRGRAATPPPKAPGCPCWRLRRDRAGRRPQARAPGHTRNLRRAGWQVLRRWEHALRAKPLPVLVM